MGLTVIQASGSAEDITEAIFSAAQDYVEANKATWADALEAMNVANAESFQLGVMLAVATVMGDVACGVLKIQSDKT